MAFGDKLGALIGTLKAAGIEATFTELRDLLWLAPQISMRADSASNEAFASPLAGAAPAAPSPAQAAASQLPTRGRQFPRDPETAHDSEVRLIALSDATQAGSGARVIRLRGMPALAQANAIGRALRPLARRRLGHRTVFDARATAEFIAATGLRSPVFQGAPERWFDIVLAVEQVPSMLAWRAVVAELERLLRRLGGFRSLSTLHLASGPNGAPLPLRSLHDRTGRTIVLVLSDCTSDAWWRGTMGAWLAALAAGSPLTVVQLLPPSLWPNTATGFAELRVRSPRMGAPAAALRIQKPSWATDEEGVALPVLALTPQAVGQWARMMTCAGRASSAAALFPLPGADERLPEAPAPHDAARAFRASATPPAQQLAAYFAVVKPLTAAVMRVIQQAMAPDSGALALAQVLLGGLLYPVGADAPALNPDNAEYEFYPGLRELLADALTRREFLQVNMALHDYLQQQTGTQFDFFALLQDPGGDVALPDAALPFAQFARQMPSRLPQEHGAVADLGLGLFRIVREGNALLFQYSAESGITVVRHDYDPALVARYMGDEREGYSGIANVFLARALLPVQIADIIHLAQQHPMAELVLDADTGAYPWEFLLKRTNPVDAPLALSHGLTRAVALRAASPDVDAGVLIIADPHLDDREHPHLPGARNEARAVAEAFGRWEHQRVTVLVDSDASEILAALYAEPLRVLHLAAHSIRTAHLSESSAAFDGPDGMTDRVRVLLGRGESITIENFRHMRVMPELIFLGIHFGADLVPELLHLGAQVVIAATGTIGDEEASTFAATFFSYLCFGATLIDAVREARMQCRRRHPSSDAWGRFQCHGPALWRLEKPQQNTKQNALAPTSAA